MRLFLLESGVYINVFQICYIFGEEGNRRIQLANDSNDAACRISEKDYQTPIKKIAHVS